MNEKVPGFFIYFTICNISWLELYYAWNHFLWLFDKRKYLKLTLITEAGFFKLLNLNAENESEKLYDFKLRRTKIIILHLFNFILIKYKSIQFQLKDYKVSLKI